MMKEKIVGQKKLILRVIVLAELLSSLALILSKPIALFTFKEASC